MSLIIGVGDIGARLQQAFGLRGRVPVQLDEFVVPVAITQNATDPLFVRNPISELYLSVNSFAINPAGVGVWNTIPNSILIVDSVIFADVSATATRQAVNIRVNRNQTTGPPGSNVASQAVQLNTGLGVNVLPNLETVNSYNSTPWLQGVGALAENFALPAGGIQQVPISFVMGFHDALDIYLTGQVAGTVISTMLFTRVFQAGQAAH